MTNNKLYDIATSYLALHLCYAMVKLEITDALYPGPATFAALSSKTGVPEQSLRRIGNGLRLLELVEIAGDGLKLTSSGRLLCSEHPQSISSLVLLAVEQFIPAWAHLPQATKAGITGFELTFGQDLFTYNDPAVKPEMHFHRFMEGIARDLSIMLGEAFDFSRVQTILDVGGGTGILIRHLLEKYPHGQGGLLESDSMIREATVANSDLIDQNRLSLFAGNFFKSIPSGYDIYILSQILHDWEDEDAEKILINCHQAMPAHGQLLILTCLMPAPAERSDFGVLSDLNMLVLTGGKERTLTEYHSLLNNSGFVLKETIPMKMDYYLLIAIKSE